ncbi:Hypothetical predicted protein [Mytilus galloprovincialis]|uniref:Uncharacterized protein n=1 Tax=Mytilus galloprovincialis TaxID=29158 RepID=A0A8B6EGP0_MYTGA|nr:Hypothetical predicted protein [Mytilus galloprovincialis]
MMRSNGDIDSANLCHDIRSWWQADDTPGIESQERQIMRESLRRRLLSYIDFRMFPPKTMYVNGWPSQLWEALLASIDAKIWLYALCHGSTYNVRAFSSMVGETFFSEVAQNDRRGHGTVSCQEFGQFIGNTIEQVQIRLDPERQFSNHTFDSAGRKRLNGRKREATISTDRNALCKGELGIRWEKARCNQAKLLPTVKMGIE